MVSYKLVLSKLFSNSTQSSDTPSQPKSPYHAGPRRAMSSSALPTSLKGDLGDLTRPPRRRKVLVRNRPHSATLASLSSNHNGLSRSLTTWIRHSTTRTGSQHAATPPMTPVLDITSTITPPLPSQRRLSSSSTRIPTHTTSPLAASESSDIDLLLSNEPEDAKKAMIKRLEGLAMALDLINAGDTLARSNAYRKKSAITFDDSMPSQQHRHHIPQLTSASSTFLSPIENWDDEDDGNATRRNSFAYYVPPMPPDTEQAGPSSHPPSESCSSDSTSRSYISSNSADEPRPPVTPVTQYPLSFHLEPISQLTLDICKSTPSPIFPLDHRGLVPVENLVVSWVAEGQLP